MIGNRLTQADVTAACAFTFLAYPALGAHGGRREELPAFRAAKARFFAPAQPTPADSS
jgi:glutathione S-transferase